MDEYAETKAYVDEEKPYWLFLDAERGQELRYGLFNYFPAAHYKQAIDQALLDEVRDDELVPDGGRYTETLYAWYDPDTDTYLTHAEAGHEFATPFFEAEDDARRFLEHRSRELDDTAHYENLSLQKMKAKKIGEALEVLTDQAGIEDFMPDGGHQIDNPGPDELWFWYDPVADRIIQEEVEPYEVVGLFASENHADRFVRQYADQYGLEDVSHLEKYRADLSYEGHGPVLDDSDADRSEEQETEQIEVSEFDG